MGLHHQPPHRQLIALTQSYTGSPSRSDHTMKRLHSVNSAPGSTSSLLILLVSLLGCLAASLWFVSTYVKPIAGNGSGSPGPGGQAPIQQDGQTWQEQPSQWNQEHYNPWAEQQQQQRIQQQEQYQKYEADHRAWEQEQVRRQYEQDNLRQQEESRRMQEQQRLYQQQQEQQRQLQQRGY